MIRNIGLEVDLDRVETIREAASRLSVSESAVRKWIQRGQLRPLVVGVTPILLFVDDVDACAVARGGNSRNVARRRRIRRARERFEGVS